MRTEPCPAKQTVALAALRERLSSIEHRSSSARPVPTGWDELDRAFARAGLQRGSVHEWIGLEPRTGSRAARWLPPLSVLVHLARRAVQAAAQSGEPIHVCWIGPRVWPSVPSLTSGGVETGLLSRSLFVDESDAGSRLWAADLALRSPSVLVIADGSGLDMAASRRLQLAAEAGGWLAHLARPPGEAGEISAAATRWAVAREPSEGDEPRFSVRLLRGKGLLRMQALDRRFVLQREDRDRLVVVHSGVRDRPGPQAVGGRSEGPDPARARRASA